ncbi:MAG: DUF3137 domain-containing protein [Nocardioides sp.]
MHTGVFIGFAVLVVVLFFGIAVMGAIAAKKRREGIAALAAHRGWTYAERDDRWCDAFQGSPFGLGHNRRATNVLLGQFDARPFVSFDYVYHTTQTSTDSKGHTTSREISHPYGVAGLDMGAAFPALEVTPEGMFGRLVGRLTNSDIELESEDFNRAFTVKCPDRKLASDVLHPRMMELLLRSPDAAFRFDQSWILDCENGQVALEEIEPRLRRIDSIVDQVPEFVWKEVRG